MDGHQQQHNGSCNCKSANPAVQQTLDEMEFERGIWTAGEEIVYLSLTTAIAFDIP